MATDIRTQIMNYLSLSDITAHEVIILYIINDWPFELSRIKTIQLVQEDIEEVYRVDWNIIIDFFDLHGLKMTLDSIASIIDNLIKKGYLIVYTDSILEMIKKLWLSSPGLNHFQILAGIGDIGVSPMGEQVALYVGKLLDLSDYKSCTYMFSDDNSCLYYSTHVKPLKELMGMNECKAEINKCGPWIGYRWWKIFPIGYHAIVKEEQNEQ